LTDLICHELFFLVFRDFPDVGRRDPDLRRDSPVVFLNLHSCRLTVYNCHVIYPYSTIDALIGYSINW